MGFTFDEAKKKLNLDETLEKVSKVVHDAVEQIDDAIDKGRETLTEKFDRDGTTTDTTAEPAADTPEPGEDQPKPDYTI